MAVTEEKLLTLSHSSVPSQPNKSIAGAMECLLYIVSQPKPIGSRELARALEMEPTRANRMLGTLARLGFLEQSPDRKYRSGPGVHVFAAMAIRSSTLIHSALPHIQKLHDQTGLRCALGVLWRTNISYIYHGKPGNAIYEGIGGCDLYPAIKSSIGHVLLSHWTDEEVLSMYNQDNADSLSETETQNLLKQLNFSREKNFGISSDQTSIAVSIGRRAVAGLALMGSKEQPLTDSLIDNYLPVLQETAAEITNDLDAK